MDNHPIPQDVTGFQFKLIGAMTIKQFAYVAFGVVMAVIIYYSPVNIFLKILLIPIFGLGGTILAFLPVEGRPVDVMVFNFFKSLVQPNQFIYQKTSRQFSFNQALPVKTAFSSGQPTTQDQIYEKKQQLQTFLGQPAVKAQSKLDEKENTFLQSVTSTPLAVPQVAEIQAQPTAAPPPLVRPEPAATKQEQVMPGITQQPQVVISPKPEPDQRLQPIQAQLAINQQPVQQVAVAPQPAAKAVGLHIPDVPNIILGIVKDSRNNVLAGMLVEVKDKDGNPVRAFKTNALGQFSSATPLAFGTYSVEIDDPKKQHNFSPVQIIANNQILLPIEVISRDAREDLRKELFN